MTDQQTTGPNEPVSAINTDHPDAAPANGASNGASPEDGSIESPDVDASSEGPGDGIPDDASDARAEVGESAKLVPVGEAIRYRKRAQAAEQDVEALRRQLQDVEANLANAKAQAATAERRREIDRALFSAKVIDVDAARVLLESELAQREADDDDPRAVIEEWRGSKPYLFRDAHSSSASSSSASSSASARGMAGAMNGAVRPQSHSRAGASMRRAAQRAAHSGDRHNVLEYMRLRRGQP